MMGCILGRPFGRPRFRQDRDLRPLRRIEQESEETCISAEPQTGTGALLILLTPSPCGWAPVPVLSRFSQFSISNSLTRD